MPSPATLTQFTRLLRGWSLRRWAASAVAATTAVLMIALVVGYASVTSAYNKIDHQSMGDLGTRPQIVRASHQSPVNILVIGSDTREGGNAEYGASVGGQRGDVTMLLQLSADRTRATGVSIPRDSMVQMPACIKADGSMSKPQLQMFNAAYALGGVNCTIRTVEHLTGVYIHHFVIVDFAGFKAMVDALGTVPICVPHAVNDPKSNLVLPAGRHLVGGETALAFVRNRTLGQGGDLGRVKRQQMFIGTLIEQARSRQVLTNPAKLMRFLNAAAGSLTTDDQLDRNEMISLARSVRQIGMDNITFITVPTTSYAPDPNRLAWSDQAQVLWQALRTDTPIGQMPAHQQGQAGSAEAGNQQANVEPAPSQPGQNGHVQNNQGLGTQAPRAQVLPGDSVPDTRSGQAPDSPSYAQLHPTPASQNVCS